jgi:hypothetical protein
VTLATRTRRHQHCDRNAREAAAHTCKYFFTQRRILARSNVGLQMPYARRANNDAVVVRT